MKLNESYLYKICLALVLFTIFAAAVFFVNSPFTWGHDIYAHLTYAKIFDRALSQGQFPVRYVESIQNGFSQPLFNYYQVGFYYLVSIFNLILNSITLSTKISVVFLWLMGTFFVFLLTRKFGKFESLFAALIYAFSPYLFFDIIIRASYPEFAAISLVPAILFFLEKTLFKPNRLYVIFLSLFIGAMLISHMPAFIIFSPVLLSYFLFLVIKNRPKINGVLSSFAGGFLGVTLAGFYILPAIFELSLIKSSLLKSSAFDFTRHFLSLPKLSSLVFEYSGFSSPKNASILISSTTGIILMPGKRIFNSHLLFWFGVVMFSLFMINKSSIQVWETLSFISFIQFPWRFLMITPIALAIISAQLLKSTQNVFLKSSLILFTVMLVFVVYGKVTISQLFVDLDYFDQNFTQLQSSPEALKQAYKEPGYNPKGADLIPSNNTPPWVNTKGAQVTELSLKDDYKSFKVSANDPTTLQLNSRFFPGWNGYIDQKKMTIQTIPGSHYMSIEIPKGEHIIEFKLEDTFVRRMANLLTGSSAAVLSLILLSYLLNRKVFFSGLFRKSFNGISKHGSWHFLSMFSKKLN